jgi:dimethylsulfone monooxygenase
MRCVPARKALRRTTSGFLHFQEDVEYFGSRVLPLVREIEESEEDSVGEPVLASA